MWKQVLGSAFCGIFWFGLVSLKFRIKRRAGIEAGPTQFSITLCARSSWLAVPPSLQAEECGFGRGAGVWHPLQIAPCFPAAAVSGSIGGCFSCGLSSSWSPNWKYLGAAELYLLFPFKSWCRNCWICLMMEGLRCFIHLLGQLPGQVTEGLLEQMNKEVW